MVRTSKLLALSSTARAHLDAHLGRCKGTVARRRRWPAGGTCRQATQNASAALRSCWACTHLPLPGSHHPVVEHAPAAAVLPVSMVHPSPEVERPTVLDCKPGSKDGAESHALGGEGASGLWSSHVRRERTLRRSCSRRAGARPTGGCSTDGRVLNRRAGAQPTGGCSTDDDAH